MSENGNPESSVKTPLAVLAGKMAQVMGKLSRIKKAGVNVEQKWKYATIDDITDAIREAMSEAGLALFATMVESSVEPAQSIYGKSLFRARVKIDFELVCSDTGASKIMHWDGYADDFGDKALNKAATYAEKFWLLRTFLVSTGEDDEDDPDRKSPGQEREDGKRSKEPLPRVRDNQRQPQASTRPAGNAPTQQKLPDWLTAENKSKLIGIAIKAGKLATTANWLDFLKVAGLKDDAACAQFKSGSDLYAYFEKQAATPQSATQDSKTVVVRRARHSKNIVFPEAEVTWFKGRKELAKLVGDEFAVVMDVSNWDGTEKTPKTFEFPPLTLHLVKPAGKQFYEIVAAEVTAKPGVSPFAAADSPAGEKIDPNDIDAFLGDVDPARTERESLPG